jgi:hypothetical protein
MAEHDSFLANVVTTESLLGLSRLDGNQTLDFAAKQVDLQVSPRTFAWPGEGMLASLLQPLARLRCVTQMMIPTLIWHNENSI